MAEKPAWARLWDAPTRIVHWALILLLGFAWWSAEEGHLQWHRGAGYGIVGLVLFRLIWGFAGSSTAKFSGFLRGPAATLAYLKSMHVKATPPTKGHNPVGAWSVVAMLAVLAFQVTTGLFTVDIDAFDGGPLSDRVDFDTGRMIAGWHEASFTVLQGLVILHLAAIAFYAVYKRQDLIAPMITGRKRLGSDAGVTFAPLWRAVLAAAIAAGLAWFISNGLRL